MGLRDMFAAIDTKGKGYVTLSDINNGLEILGLEEQPARHIQEAFDGALPWTSSPKDSVALDFEAFRTFMNGDASTSQRRLTHATFSASASTHMFMARRSIW